MSNPNIVWPEDNLADQAAYWMTILQSENCTDVDHKSFNHWVEADEANKDAFEDLLSTWHDCSGLADDPTLLDIRRKALSPAAPQKNYKRFYAVAAVLIVSLFATFAAIKINVAPPEPTTEQLAMDAGIRAPLPEPLLLSTAIGERSTVHLEDGSTVELNTDTAIQVVFTDAERRLTLQKGQAMFNVAHDIDRPFVVYAGDRRVTALGTEFEVKFANETVAAVTLLEGSVQVDELMSARNIEKPIVRRTVELAPGQRLSSKVATPEIIPEDVLERSLGWRQGKLMFDGEMLGDVVPEINRYSTRKVVLADPELANLPVSGKFHAGSSDSFAAAVSNYYDLAKVNDPKNQKIIIRRK